MQRSFSSFLPLFSGLAAGAFFIGNRYAHIPQDYRSSYIFFSLSFAGILFLTVTLGLKKVIEKPGRLAAYAFVIATSVLPFLFVMYADYWPYNHDYLAFKERLVLYTQHFYQWDFFPYWSTGDAMGLGAPLPLYYHKLFYWVAASYCVLFGSIKDSTLLALVTFTLIGLIGMYRSLRLLELDQWPALFLAAAYGFQFYSVTDWFIRGAMAEYSALMITPWLLWWCLRLLVQRYFSLWIAAVLSLLFYAHNVIAYYSFYVLAAAVLMHLLRERSEGVALRNVILRGSAAAALFLLSIAIYAVPMFLVRHTFDPGRVVWDMSWTFRPFLKYFYDRDYGWHTFDTFTVALSPLLWITPLVLLVALGWRIILTRTKSESTSRISRAEWFVMATLVFFFVLQLPFTLAVYNAVPGANFVQYPWRLLTFIQPLLLLLIGVLVTRVVREGLVAVWTCGFLLLGFIASYPVFKSPSTTYEWYSRSEIEVFRNNGVFGTSGEYMPNVDSLPKGIHIFYLELSAKDTRYNTDSTATVERQPMANPESLTQHFTVRAATATEIILPINYSGLELVNISSGNESQRIEPRREPNDPRIHLDVPRGISYVTVRLPNVLNLFRR